LFVLLFTRLALQGIVYYTFRCTVGRQHSLPPGGRWHAKRDGRSPRYFEISNTFLVTRSPSPDFVVSSLPEGAFGLCVPKVLLFFLTSTAFVDTKAKPRGSGNVYSSKF